MEDFNQTFSDFHGVFKQMLSDSCHAIMQGIQDIVENMRFKVCHLAGNVVEEIEELNSNRNVSFNSEIGASVEMLDENRLVELKKLNGRIELQAITEIDFLMERHRKEGVINYGRFSEEKSKFLRWQLGCLISL